MFRNKAASATESFGGSSLGDQGAQDADVQCDEIEQGANDVVAQTNGTDLVAREEGARDDERSEGVQEEGTQGPLCRSFVQLMELWEQERELNEQIKSDETSEDEKNELSAQLNNVYEEIEKISGSSAEARASKILHGLVR
eukprot:TRINITY_DN4487_c0_g1_i3.p2 TRINITY_DN4487_c0_g1~~TRINITY_DN4487_c0_g1_i3.p2  ORF type:complete len:141 (-),score=25.50 TRINITY_DN4487_c0_g1_i3:117-539(-)